MAEEIVACPGCAKKFRIPEGAPGGSFQCTACDATVTYGRPSTPGRAAPAPSRSAHPPRGRTRRTAARRAAATAVAEGEEHIPYRPQRQQMNPAVMWTCLVLTLAGIVLVLIWLPSTGKVPLADRVPEFTEKKPDTSPVDPTGPKIVVPPPEVVDAEKARINAEKMDYLKARQKWDKATNDELFGPFDNIEGETAEERANLDATVRDLMFSKGAREPLEKLKQAGRKAMPSLLGAFGAQWKSSQWVEPEDQSGSYQVQKLLAEITQKSNPVNSYAFYMEGSKLPPDNFVRIARNWSVWWRAQGFKLTQYKASTD